MGKHSRIMAWGAAVSMGMFLALGVGFAADPPQNVDALIAKLANPQADVREQATSALLTHPQMTHERLSAAVKAKPSAEVRHRLRRIAIHRFLKAVKLEPEQRDDFAGSCLGVTFSIIYPTQDQGARNPGVVITNVLPGLPAYEHLRVGDVIVGTAGDPLPENLDIGTFLTLIQRATFVRFDVERNGKVFPARIDLDRSDRMNYIYKDNATIATRVRIDLEDHLITLGLGESDEPAISLEPPTGDAPKQPTK